MSDQVVDSLAGGAFHAAARTKSSCWGVLLLHTHGKAEICEPVVKPVQKSSYVRDSGGHVSIQRRGRVIDTLARRA